jgi:ribosomal protein S17E
MGNKREDDIRTELKAKKKGFIKKKLLDVSWDGALSKELNSDTELKKGLLTLGIDNLKIEPDGKNDCIRIMHEKKIAVIEDMGGDSSKIVEDWDENEKRVEELPSMEIFETINTIAGYVKSI